MNRTGDGADQRRGKLRQLLTVTAASVLLPGLAHVRGGRRATGLLILSICYGLFIALGLAIIVQREHLAELAVRPEWLTGLLIGAPLAGLGWALVVLRSYAIMQPRHLRSWQQGAGAVAVSLLCATVLLPFGAVARYAYLQRDLVTTLFGEPEPVPSPAGHAGAPTAMPPAKQRQRAWQGQSRITVLLIGSDAGPGRRGARTDSLLVASIHVKTGRTVLFSVPRNLQQVRFPPGSEMSKRYPRGFDNLLNAVYGYGTRHPEVTSGAADPGAELLKSTIGYTLGMPIDYYVMVNMRGFAAMVDAIGGVTVTVRRPVAWGNKGVVFQPGTYRLRGEQALMYARSRTGSSDYSRMGRQRCLIGWITRQATPLTVLRRFHRLTKATKNLVSTDIPRPMLAGLVRLAAKAKRAQMTSLIFAPPVITPAWPDWQRIRALSARAIRDSERGLTGSTPAVRWENGCD